MTERTFRLFDKELDKLRTRLLKMGSVAFEQVDCAFKALLDADHELVKKVIDWEAKVDKYDVKIDRLCMRMLALQQPVAKDLRSVMTALALNAILERVGDLAVNIAEHIEHLIDHQELVASSPLPKMEPVIAEMLKNSFDAYLYEDVELARRVAEMDNELDDLDRETFRYCIDRMKEDPALIEPASHLMFLSRHAERLGDQATNIAVNVVFLVDAKIVKHKNWGQPVDANDFDDDAM